MTPESIDPFSTVSHLADSTACCYSGALEREQRANWILSSLLQSLHGSHKQVLDALDHLVIRSKPCTSETEPTRKDLDAVQETKDATETDASTDLNKSSLQLQHVWIPSLLSFLSKPFARAVQDATREALHWKERSEQFEQKYKEEMANRLEAEGRKVAVEKAFEDLWNNRQEEEDLKQTRHRLRRAEAMMSRDAAQVYLALGLTVEGRKEKKVTGKRLLPSFKRKRSSDVRRESVEQREILRNSSETQNQCQETLIDSSESQSDRHPSSALPLHSLLPDLWALQTLESHQLTCFELVKDWFKRGQKLSQLSNINETLKQDLTQLISRCLERNLVEKDFQSIPCKQSRFSCNKSSSDTLLRFPLCFTARSFPPSFATSQHSSFLTGNTVFDSPLSPPSSSPPWQSFCRVLFTKWKQTEKQFQHLKQKLNSRSRRHLILSQLTTEKKERIETMEAASTDRYSEGEEEKHNPSSLVLTNVFKILEEIQETLQQISIQNAALVQQGKPLDSMEDFDKERILASMISKNSTVVSDESSVFYTMVESVGRLVRETHQKLLETVEKSIGFTKDQRSDTCEDTRGEDSIDCTCFTDGTRKDSTPTTESTAWPNLSKRFPLATQSSVCTSWKHCVFLLLQQLHQSNSQRQKFIQQTNVSNENHWQQRAKRAEELLEKGFVEPLTDGEDKQIETEIPEELSEKQDELTCLRNSLSIALSHMKQEALKRQGMEEKMEQEEAKVIGLETALRQQREWNERMRGIFQRVVMSVREEARGVDEMLVPNGGEFSNQLTFSSSPLLSQRPTVESQCHPLLLFLQEEEEKLKLLEEMFNQSQRVETSSKKVQRRTLMEAVEKCWEEVSMEKPSGQTDGKREMFSLEEEKKTEEELLKRLEMERLRNEKWKQLVQLMKERIEQLETQRKCERD